MSKEESKGLDNSSKELITEKLVWDTLNADFGEGARLKSYKVVDFTSKGDNYSCLVTSVLVKYTRGNDRHEKSYVAKVVLPHVKTSGGLFADLFNQMFIKEVTCYFEILPRLSKILKDLGLKEVGFAKAYTKRLDKNGEVMIIEDLRTRGFKMFDRRRGMDVPHATLVLHELATLHAASHILESKFHHRNLTKEWPCLLELFMQDDIIKTFLGTVFGGQIEGGAKIMEKVPNYEHVVKWLRKIRGEAAEIFIDNLDQNNKFVVLNHGDCWNNNLLFRYDEVGSPVEVIPVDLQAMRRASAANDLSYFLYSSFNGSGRRDNIKMYLKIYHDCFKGIMKAAKVPLPFTYLELYQEFRRKMVVGCMAGIFLAQIVLSEAEDVGDFAAATTDEESLKKFSEERQATLMKMSEREDGLLRSRLLDMFDEMVEAGVIPQQ